jgi:hypothetical protein
MPGLGPTEQKPAREFPNEESQKVDFRLFNDAGANRMNAKYFHSLY